MSDQTAFDPLQESAGRLKPNYNTLNVFQLGFEIEILSNCENSQQHKRHLKLKVLACRVFVIPPVLDNLHKSGNVMISIFLMNVSTSNS